MSWAEAEKHVSHYFSASVRDDAIWINDSCSCQKTALMPIPCNLETFGDMFSHSTDCINPVQCVQPCTVYSYEISDDRQRQSCQSASIQRFALRCDRWIDNKVQAGKMFGIWLRICRWILVERLMSSPDWQLGWTLLFALVAQLHFRIVHWLAVGA